MIVRRPKARPARATNDDLLDDASLGQLRHIVNLARQNPGDWSDMGPYDPTQEGDDAYRYQLAYMAYALALAQYHHTPAYRELYQDTIARLIEKMLRWETWGYWELTSRGSKLLDPDLVKLGDGWVDPVMRQNVMYSGHLLMMVGLYEMLYRDRRFDAPGALTFQFRPVFRGMGPQDFPYNHGKLAEAIFSEFERNDFLGCECEPNAIFVYCNQFPMLGFMHYDLTHGTDLAKRTIPKFKKRWADRSSMFRDAEADLPIFYRLRQNDFIYEDSSDNNEGITAVAWASVMHAWAKEYVEKVYPRGRDRIIRPMPDGTVGVRLASYLEKHRGYQAKPGADLADPMMVGVHIFGTLALAAAEVGDLSTLEPMLAYADRYMKPARKNGGLYYPRNDDLSSDGYTTALVGNALLAAARLCPRDGFWQLYNRPWSEAEISRPILCDVSYPDVLVRRATYDNDGRTLNLVLAPGSKETGVQNFTVANIDPEREIRIELDGEVQAPISSLAPASTTDNIKATLDANARSLRLTLSLGAERRLAIENH